MLTKKTIFSPDRAYRYTLWRDFDLFNPTYVQFIGLNPSTADETQDDPTVRRCIDFAKRWGYGALCMTNIFAFRATDPRVMKAQIEPIGSENDKWLECVAADAGIVIAAWGIHGAHMERARAIAAALPDLHCLGTTKNGHPRHPLYVKSSVIPTPFGKTSSPLAKKNAL